MYLFLIFFYCNMPVASFKLRVWHSERLFPLPVDKPKGDFCHRRWWVRISGENSRVYVFCYSLRSAFLAQLMEDVHQKCPVSLESLCTALY